MSSSSACVSKDASSVLFPKFTPLMGHWSFSQTGARYSGALNDGDVAGLALSDTSLSSGTVKATIAFDTDRVEYTSAGIVLGYADQSSPYLAIELAAYEAAYAVAEFAPVDGNWQKLKGSGCFRSIAPTRPYSIEVVQLKRGVTLVVDQVRVLEYDLTTPLAGARVGLFGWGGRTIRFENVTVQPAPVLFVAMQFSQRFDTLYREVIQPKATRKGFSVVRMDEFPSSGLVVDDIKRQIARAKVVLAEITSQNPNVMWELGYAEALEKPLILLAQRGEELPFDIRNRRVIFYDDTIGGKPALEDLLEKHLSADI